MNDPTKQPGYHFSGMRVLSATCLAVELPAPGVAGDIDIQYADRYRVQETSILFVQSITVRILDAIDRNRLYFQASVELEGRFDGIGEINIEPRKFAEEIAPSILFPFSREWIHRLTSAAPPWPPVLLPPLNLSVIRKKVAAAAEPQAKRGRRKLRRS